MSDLFDAFKAFIEQEKVKCEKVSEYSDMIQDYTSALEDLGYQLEEAQRLKEDLEDFEKSNKKI